MNFLFLKNKGKKTEKNNKTKTQIKEDKLKKENKTRSNRTKQKVHKHTPTHTHIHTKKPHKVSFVLANYSGHGACPGVLCWWWCPLLSRSIQKLFSFMRSHLLTFSLSACATGDLFRRSFPVSLSSRLFITFFETGFLTGLLYFLLSLLCDFGNITWPLCFILLGSVYLGVCL